MGIIRGFSELLLEDAEANSNREAHLRFIITTVDQIQVLVDDSIRPDDVPRTQEIFYIFYAHLELDIASLQKTIRALIDGAESETPRGELKDLERMRMALNELREAAFQLI